MSQRGVFASVARPFSRIASASAYAAAFVAAASFILPAAAEEYVAKVGETEYETLAAAVNALTGGEYRLKDLFNY